MTIFRHLHSLALAHHGDLSLLGMTPTGEYFVELAHGDGWQQLHLSATGELMAQTPVMADEGEPLRLPPELSTPSSVSAKHPLHFGVFRTHGMREAERVADWVKPLSIMQKMMLIREYALNIPAMMLFGVGYSHVRAVAPLKEGEFVIRTLGLVVALAQIQHTPDHEPYDYVMQPVRVAYVRTEDDDFPTERMMAGLDGIKWVSPCDCLVFQNRLVLADGGNATNSSHIHLWDMT